MMRQEAFVFIANGGRGKRLQARVPELQSGILPKGIAIKYEGLPLIKRQLHQIEDAFKLSKIVLSFTNDQSVREFEQLIALGILPDLNYLFTLNSYSEQDTGTDVFMSYLSQSQTSFDRYTTIVESSGDLFLSSDVYSGAPRTFDTNYICEKDLWFGTHQPRMTNFQFKLDESNQVVGFEKVTQVPNKILGHPMFLTPQCAELKRDMPKGSSNRFFVMRALEEGHNFKVLKPETLINVNTPTDLDNLHSLQQKNNP